MVILCKTSYFCQNLHYSNFCLGISDRYKDTLLGHVPVFCFACCHLYLRETRIFCWGTYQFSALHVATCIWEREGYYVVARTSFLLCMLPLYVLICDQSCSRYLRIYLWQNDWWRKAASCRLKIAVIIQGIILCNSILTAVIVGCSSICLL